MSNLDDRFYANPKDKSFKSVNIRSGKIHRSVFTSAVGSQSYIIINAHNYEIYKQISPEGLIEMLSLSPGEISLIDNPTQEMCELAIKLKPHVITYLANQSVELCLLALNTPITTKYFIDNKEFKPYMGVRIVDNPDHETTLRNLMAKKEVMLGLKE